MTARTAIALQGAPRATWPRAGSRIRGVRLDLVRRQSHLDGDLCQKEQGNDDEHANDAPEPCRLLGVRGLFREVGRHVPAEIIEDRDQHSRAERVECAESGREEPVPRENFGGRRARVPDRETTDQDQGAQFEQGQHDLHFGGRGDAASDKREHAKKPKRADAGCPNHVMEVFRRDKFERRLAGGKRRGDHKNRGEAEQRPARHETEDRMDGAADPGIGGTGIRSPQIQIGEGTCDADHRQERDNERRRSGEPNGGDEGRGGGGDRIGRRRAGDSHDG